MLIQQRKEKSFDVFVGATYSQSHEREQTVAFARILFFVLYTSTVQKSQVLSQYTPNKVSRLQVVGVGFPVLRTYSVHYCRAVTVHTSTC